MKSRLAEQLEFIFEIDKIKSIFRKTMLFNKSRHENDAEHAWHIALMAIILQEYSNVPIDVSKVIKMLLIHDIVEIDAGDVAVYDTRNRERVKEVEKKAAQRIFGLLPADQKQEMVKLWQEFEARMTVEAKFAAALDRIEPILQNYLTQGITWRELHVSLEKVLETNQHIQEGSEELWNYIKSIIIDTFSKFN
jgi:putative hydrolase of HD superfamily